MKVLFVCNGNVGRSQAAEAYFNRLSKKNTAISAGINTEKYGNRRLKEISGTVVVKCLMEDGVDISEKRSKQITKAMVEEADLVISMENKLPDYVDKKIIFWEIENPKGYPLEKYRGVRDQIKKKVEELVGEIG